MRYEGESLLLATDGRTDSRKDGRTDKVGYRGACYAPKNNLTPLNYQGPEYFWWINFIGVLFQIIEKKSKIRGVYLHFFLSFLIWSFSLEHPFTFLYFSNFYIILLFFGNKELQKNKSRASNI